MKCLHAGGEHHIIITPYTESTDRWRGIESEWNHVSWFLFYFIPTDVLATVRNDEVLGAPCTLCAVQNVVMWVSKHLLIATCTTTNSCSRICCWLTHHISMKQWYQQQRGNRWREEKMGEYSVAVPWLSHGEIFSFGLYPHILSYIHALCRDLCS